MTRILIVEDDAVQAEVLERTLVTLGYSVQGKTHSGSEAVHLVEEYRPDLILMDIHLAGEMDGIEAAARIPGSYHIPVLFLTSDNDESTLQRAKSVSPSGFLLKPLKQRELRAAIETCMNTSAVGKTLRQTEERYRALFDSASDAILILDGSTIADCNASSLSMFGCSRDDIVGKTPFSFSPPYQEDHRPSHVAGEARISSALQGKTEVFEWTHCRNDGTPFAAEVRLTRLRLQDRSFLQAVVRDIDARKQAETSLQHERILLRTLIDNLPDAIYVKDRESRKTVANLADVRNSGLKAESDLLGKNDFDVFPPDIAAGFYADDQSVIQSGIPVLNREEYVTCDNGQKRWLLTTKLPLRDNTGQINGLIGIGHDISHIKKAEESLRLFRTLIDNSSDAIEVIDPDTGRILDANAKAWKDLGYTREELLSLSLQDIALRAGPSDLKTMGSDVRLSESLVFDSQHRRKDGSVFPVEVNMKYVQLDRGYVVAVARDTTKRKHAEKVLLESERRLSEIIQFFPEATMVIDRNGIVLAWNRAMEQLSGVHAGDILGKGNYEYALPFYGERRAILADVVMKRSESAREKYDDFIWDGDKVSAETYISNRNGGQSYVLATATALRDSGGHIYGAIESLLDMTARQRAELALRESEERFRLISENVADIIVVLDRESRCLYASPSSRQEGIDPDQIAGTSFLDCIHPGDLAEVKKTIDRILDDHHHQSLGFRLGVAGRPWRFKEATMSLLVDDAETRIVAVIRDVTDRITREEERSMLQGQLHQRNLELENNLLEMRQMQEGLVQSEKMASIGQLTAGIAHEINNPLAFVSSNLNRFSEYFQEMHAIVERWDGLKNEMTTDPRYQERVLDIADAEDKADLTFVVEDFSRLMKHTLEGTERIRSIVEHLRGFTHLAVSGFDDADLNAAIDDTLDLTRNELKYKATILKSYGSLPKIGCNIGEIKQVLVNLLVNAAHALAEKGTISITTRLIGTNAVIQIEDTGSGIQPEHLKKIFDPFFTTKPVGKGTGLGLWISATIVQKHNGRITAHSEPGRGTTMTVELPVRQRERGGSG